MKTLGLMLALLLLVSGLTEQKSKATKKPKSISAELYCGACQAIVRETLKRLRHKSLQSDVIEAMDDLCDLWRYNTYDFPPPQMHKGCEAIQRDYEEELEWALTHRKELKEDVETYFCSTVTKACTDIDMNFVPKSDDHITVDGEKVPVDNGKVDLSQV